MLLFLFLLGLYQRAMILNAAISDPVEFTVPLHLIHPFWCLDVIMPMKHLVELHLRRNQMSKVIIKKESDNETYSLDVTSAHLDLSLISLEANIRREFYRLVFVKKLVRVWLKLVEVG